MLGYQPANSSKHGKARQSTANTVKHGKAENLQQSAVTAVHSAARGHTVEEMLHATRHARQYAATYGNKTLHVPADDSSNTTHRVGLNPFMCQ